MRVRLSSCTKTTTSKSDSSSQRWRGRRGRVWPGICTLVPPSPGRACPFKSVSRSVIPALPDLTEADHLVSTLSLSCDLQAQRGPPFCPSMFSPSIASAVGSYLWKSACASAVPLCAPDALDKHGHSASVDAQMRVSALCAVKNLA